MTLSIDSLPANAVLIPAYGAGVDSTAMLVGMVRRRIPVEAILFADTGSEKPPTISYIPIISEWLVRHGYPPVTTVRYRPKHDRYTSLGGACVANGVLPSLAYGGKSCSIKFKASVQEDHIFGKSRGPWAGAGIPAALEARARGEKIIRAIGYDAGPKDSRRSSITSDDRFDYVYPLREWGMDRIDCVETILDAGLPLPIKSACFFCPASKPLELIWLHAHHPDQFMAALEIEEIARPKLEKVEGLWRKSTRTRPGSWVEWAIGERLAERLPDGRLRLIPHEGVLPPHPDDEVARLARARMAA